MKKTIIGAACIIGFAMLSGCIVLAVRLSFYFGDSIPTQVPIRGWIPLILLLVGAIYFTIKGLKEKDQ